MASQRGYLDGVLMGANQGRTHGRGARRWSGLALMKVSSAAAYTGLAR